MFIKNCFSFRRNFVLNKKSDFHGFNSMTLIYNNPVDKYRSSL